MGRNKTISSANIIGKVKRDFKLPVNSWMGEAVEWIGEMIGLIGVHAEYEKKSIVLTSISHRCPYPCDYESTLMIEYQGCRLPKREHRYDNFCNNTTSQNFSYIYSKANINDHIIKEIQSIKTIHNNAYYQEQPNYINTSFESDKFKLYYTGLPLDAKGFPLIPDVEEVRAACAWYILAKWLGQGNIHPTFNYQDAEARASKWQAKAENELAYPSIDDMEAFTNMWTRVVFDRTAASNFYEGSELVQYIDEI